VEAKEGKERGRERMRETVDVQEGVDREINE
jgi:hypothetical protein